MNSAARMALIEKIGSQVVDLLNSVESDVRPTIATGVVVGIVKSIYGSMSKEVCPEESDNWMVYFLEGLSANVNDLLKKEGRSAVFQVLFKEEL